MDIARLEKLGRELKCPICLSLVKAAVTLACNHVFCNSCIVESMKSVSSCPVCKVPFRRREVRPAPHMDNLVSIYKSMEASSGYNIFTSQVAPSKNAEKPSPVADYKKTNTPESTMMSQSSSKGKRLSKGKRKKMEKVDSMTSNPCPPTRPSFSSNKRIHVTPYPISETPITQKRANKLAVSTNKDTNIIELQDNNEQAYRGLEDPTLQPFFWLREANDDDDEGLERTITPEMTSLTTAKSVPCFSDIKDSDDVNTPKKLTPISKSAAQVAFDSEMFEWTQRACSPKLFSTPPNKQKAGGKRFSGFHEDKCGESFPANNKCSRNFESLKSGQLDESNKTTINTCKKKGTMKKRCKQNKGKKVESYTQEIATISLNEEHQFGSNEIVEGSSQEKEPSKQISLLRSKRKVYKSHKLNSLQPNTRIKWQLKELNGSAEVYKQINVIPVEEIQNQEIKDDSVTLAGHGKLMEVVDVKTKSQKRSKKVSFKSPKQIKGLSLDCIELKKADDNIPSNPSKDKTPNHETKKANSRRQLLSCKQNQGCGTEVKQNIQIGVVRKVEQKRLQQVVEDLSAIVSHQKQHSSTDNLMPDNQNCMNLRKFCLSSRRKELPQSTMNEVIRKCKNIHSPIRCAFCHSSNDLEVYGEMMHYCDGKSVDEDYIGGVNVIHSHKNCTEWAPDVYFKEDLVINLSTELARSRRITCSCCGIKGASLGCFEKSCQRSFHYPCAKQIPECRWDFIRGISKRCSSTNIHRQQFNPKSNTIMLHTIKQKVHHIIVVKTLCKATTLQENFVMLCPLHSSSKLPSEMSEPQKLKIKASASKGKVQPPSQLKATNDKSNLWAWPAGLPCKWVLCSSGLSGAEKEILSEFARVTGISISKAWTSAVTHVIASTDDKGSCKRTLKFLMGILYGKWILNIEWIKACMKSTKPVDEEKYEITVDVHGIHNGPRNGRMRIINKEPKLFIGFCFYFSGDFVASSKGYLQDLITAAGGKVLQRRPISREFKKQFDDSSDMTFIVYSLELPENKNVLDHRKGEATALAEDCGAKVVTNSWILDSIAASTLQALPS